MQMSEDPTGNGHVINAYEPGRVTIDHVVYQRSLLVSPERLVPDWGPRHLEALTSGDIDAILAQGPEIVVIGTGERQRFPTPPVWRRFTEAGVGCEFMDNAAACRTYTVLMSERRRVVAALLLA